MQYLRIHKATNMPITPRIYKAQLLQLIVSNHFLAPELTSGVFRMKVPISRIAHAIQICGTWLSFKYM